jgi:flagellar basal body rod protein FlgF
MNINVTAQSNIKCRKGGEMSILGLFKISKSDKYLVRRLKLAERDGLSIKASRDGILSISPEDVARSHTYKRDAEKAKTLVTG